MARGSDKVEQRNLAAKIKLPFLSNEYTITNCNFMKRYKVTESEKYRPKRHFHKFYEIHIVEDGTLTYEIDGENFNLNKNDILVIPPSCAHKQIYYSKDAILYHLTFNIENLAEDQNKKAFCLKDSKEILLLVKAIENSLVLKTENPLITGSLMFSLIASLPILQKSTILLKEPMEKKSADQRVEDAKQYINLNIESNPSVDEVASFCYLGKKQFYRIFKAHEGISPKEYLIKKQVEKIKYYITQTDMSAKEISLAMSFDNEYYFNTFFKKHFGLPPKEYKNAYNKNF